MLGQSTVGYPVQLERRRVNTVTGGRDTEELAAVGALYRIEHRDAVALGNHLRDRQPDIRESCSQALEVGLQYFAPGV